MRSTKGPLTGKQWLGLAVATLALGGGLAWLFQAAYHCESSVKLVLLAASEEPWMWGKAPAHYRLSVTGADLDADVRFDAPFKGAAGSSRLRAWEHEKGVVAFELMSPPPLFKVALDLDGTRVFERELKFAFQDTRCRRQSLYVYLPPSVAELVGVTHRESGAEVR